MLCALEDFAAGVTGMLRQILRDADCREEREIVKNTRERLRKCKDWGGSDAALFF